MKSSAQEPRSPRQGRSHPDPLAQAPDFPGGSLGPQAGSAGPHLGASSAQDTGGPRRGGRPRCGGGGGLHFTAGGRPGRLRCFLPGRGRGRQEAEGPAAPSSPGPLPGPSGPDRPLLLLSPGLFLLAPGVRLLAWPHTHLKSVRPRNSARPWAGQVRPGPRLTLEACPQGSRSPPWRRRRTSLSASHGARSREGGLRTGRAVDCGLAEVATRAGSQPRKREAGGPARLDDRPPQPGLQGRAGPRAAPAWIATWAAGPRGRDGSALPANPIGASRLRNRNPGNSPWTWSPVPPLARTSAPSPRSPARASWLRVGRAAGKTRLEGSDVGWGGVGGGN